MALNWRRGITITKDPDDVIDVIMDYTDWLTGSNTVSSIVATADTGLTVDSTSTTDSTAIARISSGTAGTTYDLEFDMTDSDGQVLSRTVRIKVSTL